MQSDSVQRLGQITLTHGGIEWSVLVLCLLEPYCVLLLF